MGREKAPSLLIGALIVLNVFTVMMTEARLAKIVASDLAVGLVFGAGLVHFLGAGLLLYRERSGASLSYFLATIIGFLAMGMVTPLGFLLGVLKLVF